MRAVVTRVRSACVTVEGKTVGRIGEGLLILLAVHRDDTRAEAEKLAKKICSLRIFEDGAGKMNLGLAEEGGSVLVVSQFTLYGNCAHGRRPEFLASARPETAIPLYEYFISLCREAGFETQTGIFGADMLVTSENDGPVTLILDTDQL